MTKPLLPWLGHRAEGLLAMVARMNSIENAARLAMADFGTESVTPTVHPDMTFAVKFGLILASLTMTGLIAVTFL